MAGEAEPNNPSEMDASKFEELMKERTRVSVIEVYRSMAKGSCWNLRQSLTIVPVCCVSHGISYSYAGRRRTLLLLS
jgi:hypothetical protein